MTFYQDSYTLIGEVNRSKVAMGVVDLNGDYLDDIVVLDNANRLKAHYQTQESRVFHKESLGMVASNDQLALGTADLDNDGLREICVGGLYDGVKIYKSFNGTTSYLQWRKTGSDFYTQNISFVDYDQDGLLDLHVNDDDGFPRLFKNVDGESIEDVDPFGYEFSGEQASGNYGSVWTDFDDDGDLDLYISKCRLLVDDPSDLRRINQLWVNDGEGKFLETAGKYALDIGEQTWVTEFSDLDNDGDKDVIMLNHTGSNLVLENKAGSYERVELGEAWNMPFEGLQLIVRDMDNDGLKDILIAGFESKLFWNKGGFTFEEDSVFLRNHDPLSFAIGDLNNDGFWDLYAGYGRGVTQVNPFAQDVLWYNNRNTNNFIKISLQGTDSNRDAIGSSCTLFGEWGIQTYEVKAGESYGISNSLSLIFGLGGETSYDSLVVRWPDGTLHKHIDIEINTHTIIQQNACTSNQQLIKADADLVLCGGTGALTLEAPRSSSYLWSTGESTQVIEVRQPGLYNGFVTDSAGCVFASGSILVRDHSRLIAPEIVNLHPQRIYCPDDVLTLSTQYSDVSWNDVNSGQVIYANARDTIIAKSNDCAGLSSKPYIANLVGFPGLVAKSDTINKGEDAVFTMNGLAVTWYNALESNEQIGQGQSFEIKELSNDTVLFATETKDLEYKDSLSFGQEVDNFGLPPNNINGDFVFSVEEFITTLSSVKCFSDTTAVRNIQVKDVWGNVLHEKEVVIGPADSIVHLNFQLLPANYYLLTTDESVNNVNLGSRSPKLKRSVFRTSIIGQESGSGNVVFRESSGGDKTLYSFYDLHFTDYDIECESQRVPVSIVVKQSSSTDEIDRQGIGVWPNPFTDKINLSRVFSLDPDYHLLSVSGMVLKTGRLEKELDLSGLLPGVYFLRIEQEVVKLVKY